MAWREKKKNGNGRRWVLALLALTQASCVPATLESGPSSAGATGPIHAMALSLPAAPAISTDPAAVPAVSLAFVGRTPLDRMRSLDCLAQAIYYEAASESEDGQRAVAQVVLNRVRHPAWPDSVCGVVYQGPMRAGGGCQFTFTCDGALAFRPGGESWARARRLAAEALAGRVYAPAAQATHYHTWQVAPAWAPRLQQLMTLGAHIFYALPGRWGAPNAFTSPYTGHEPFPRPSMSLVRRAPVPPALEALLSPPISEAQVRRAIAMPSDIPADPRWVAADTPQSTVREEYRQSGQWRTDAPTAITGR